MKDELPVRGSHSPDEEGRGEARFVSRVSATGDDPQEVRNAGLRRLSVLFTALTTLVCLAILPFSSVSLGTVLDGLLPRLAVNALVTVGFLNLIRRRLARLGFADVHLRRVATMEDFFLVVGMSSAFSVVVTIATYLLAALSIGPPVDRWLAWPEEAVGLTHPVFRGWVEANGLLGLSDWLYASTAPQTKVMFAYCLLVRRNFTPAWEFSTCVAVAGFAMLFVWALCPALSPYVYYGYRLPVEPPLSVPHMLALRSGEAFVMGEATGLVVVPSFHTVFSLLLVWIYRNERYLLPLSVIFNVGVLLSIIPSGWHYAIDLVVGALWTVGTVWFTERMVKPRRERG